MAFRITAAFFSLAIATLSLARILLSQTPGTAAANRRDASDAMAFLKGGTFEMGIDSSDIPRLQAFFRISSPQLFHDEIPRHTVTLGDFYLDKYLVTNAQFRRFVDANPDWRPGHVRDSLDNGNYLRHWGMREDLANHPDHPVVNVSWYSASAYCKWLRKRLPAEAEWEYAAGGQSNRIFPWGNEPVDKSRANFLGSGIGTTSAVGSYAPNANGIFDLVGNVWEFMADELGPYAASPQENPVAGGERPSGGRSFLEVKTRRVIRGGSFGADPVNLWIRYRDSHPPNGSREFVGFRCAK